MPTLPNRIVAALLSAAATTFVISSPAVASADTQLITNCPQPSESNGVIISDSVTACSPSGNIQINAAPVMPDYPYPWDDEFYGAALLIGGYGRGYR
ncbi:MAG: hypothetical protein ACOYO2_09755 [Mycobacterium sp.]